MHNTFGRVTVVGEPYFKPVLPVEKRLEALAKQIDELSRDMGVWPFKEAMRRLGYDVDACPDTLRRRGVDA